MPACDIYSAVSGSAVLAETASTSSLDRLGATNDGIVVFVFTNTEFASVPIVSVMYGTDSGFFVQATQNAVGDCSMETWAFTNLTETYAPVVVTYDPGTTATILVVAASFSNYGYYSFNDKQKTSTNSATTITLNATGTRTTTVPFTDNFSIAAAGTVNIFGSVVNTTATLLIDVVGGVGATRCSMAVSTMTPTGAADPMSFGWGGLASPASEALVIISGTALTGVIAPVGIVPRAY